MRAVPRAEDGAGRAALTVALQGVPGRRRGEEDEVVEVRDLAPRPEAADRVPAKVGQLVQWDVMAMGSEHHTFHVHGHRWTVDGVPRDTQTVGPAESAESADQW